MFIMSEALLEEAKKIALEMAMVNDEIRQIKFGSRDNSVFVTTNNALITPTHSFELEGKTFFVGWGLK